MSLMTAAHARRGYSLFEKLGDAAVAAGHLVGEAAQAARDASSPNATLRVANAFSSKCQVEG